MKILVSGGDGSLAIALTKQVRLNFTDIELICLPRFNMDVTEVGSIFSSVLAIKPDIFLHAGALTKPMSIHDKWRGSSIDNNIIGTANVAYVCSHYQHIKLVYISTDYVYPGIKGGYKENDPLQPINHYAISKLAGEYAVRMLDNYLILRCSHTEYPFQHLKAFTDSFKSCLYVDEAAEIIVKLIQRNAAGIVNVGGPRTSVYDFAAQSNPDVGTITRSEVGLWVPQDISMNTDIMHKIIGE